MKKNQVRDYMASSKKRPNKKTEASRKLYCDSFQCMQKEITDERVMYDPWNINFITMVLLLGRDAALMQLLKKHFKLVGFKLQTMWL